MIKLSTETSKQSILQCLLKLSTSTTREKTWNKRYEEEYNCLFNDQINYFHHKVKSTKSYPWFKTHLETTDKINYRLTVIDNVNGRHYLFGLHYYDIERALSILDGCTPIVFNDDLAYLLKQATKKVNMQKYLDSLKANYDLT